MSDILHFLEVFLEYFSEVFMIILEFMGGFVLVFGCFYVFYNFFSPRKTRNFSTKLRVKLARFTSLALEFFLAAEILKTVYIRELSELYIIAAIIILRIVMAFVVHWEMSLDMQEMREQIKEKYSQKN
ncbi:MAG: DUF1622 domain-containing protein [bacterium]